MLSQHYVKESRPKEPCPKLNLYPALYQGLSDILSSHYRDRVASSRVFICSRRDWPLILSMCSGPDVTGPTKEGSPVIEGGRRQCSSIDAFSIFDDHVKPQGFLPPIPLPRTDQADIQSLVSVIPSQSEIPDSGIGMADINDSNTSAEALSEANNVETPVQKLEVTGSNRSKTRPAEPPPAGRNKTPRWRRLFSFGKKKANSDNNLRSKNIIFSSTLTGGLPRTDSEPGNLKLNSYQSFDQFRAMTHRGIASDPPLDGNNLIAADRGKDKSGTVFDLESIYRVIVINDGASETFIGSNDSLFREAVRRIASECTSLGKDGDSEAPVDAHLHFDKRKCLAVEASIPNLVTSARIMARKDVVFLCVETASKAGGNICTQGEIRLPAPPHDWEALSSMIVPLFTTLP